MPSWYGSLSNWGCQEVPLPYKLGNEEPLVAGSFQVAEDIAIHIVEAVVGIVSAAVSIAAPGNMPVEQMQQFREIKSYHIVHRNLHLDYSACHNWDIQAAPVCQERS